MCMYACVCACVCCVCMVHDMDNLTFAEEFRGFSAQTPQIVVQNDADLPQGGCGSSTQVAANFPRIENDGNQKANFMRNNNAEGSRKTSQGSFELSL